MFRLCGSVFEVRNIAGFVGVAFLSLVGLSDAATADSCFLSPAKLSDTAVSSFKDNPDALLTSNPVGGYSLSTQVRGLVGSDTDSISIIVGLSEKANDVQVAAIAAGLAQAATACVNSRPDVAAQIQQAVAESGNQALIAAFAASIGDTQTAALTGGIGGTGGTGAGGGGAIGGAGAGAAGAGANGTDSSATNDTFSLAANGATSSISTTLGNVVAAVSPTQ